MTDLKTSRRNFPLRGISLLASLGMVLGGGPAFAEDLGDLNELHEFVGRTDVPLTLEELERRGLRSARAARQPWADTYWPDQGGSIAAPYAASGYPGLPWSFSRNLSFVRGFIDWAVRGWSSLGLDESRFLSPAQKYDLLLGDSNFTFTRRVVAMLEQMKEDGQLAIWSGVCHGWAPASIQYERPRRAFQVQGQAGHWITFFPSDVKALMSFLWAKSYAQNFVRVKGWQCRGLQRRDFTGRLLDSACFDVNPAFSFLSMVSEIGMNRRALIMDRSYGSSVQNQPTFRYEYRYVRPSNGLVTDRLEAAVQPIQSVRDPFQRFRSPRARYLVGVEMKVDYTKEVAPSHAITDDESQDRVFDATLRFDLELDSQRRIVGGEWWEGEQWARPGLFAVEKYVHPDILWIVPKDLKAWSTADADLGDEPWSPAVPMDERWRSAILRATMNEDPVGTNPNLPHAIIRPQPLTKVVDFLHQQSQ